MNSTYTGSTTDVMNGLDNFIDRSSSKIYAGYNTNSYYNMASGISETYNGSATFYKITSRADMAGAVASGIGNGGRGATVAYLSDVNRTAVLCIGDTSDKFIYFYKLSDQSYLGKMSILNTSMTQFDITGLCWDGDALAMANRGDKKIFRATLPSVINDGSALDILDEFSAPHACMYGMVWTGGSYILTNIDANTTATEFKKNSNSYTLIGAVGKFVVGAANYSLSMDYKDRVLVMGGYSNSTITCFTE